MQKQIIQAPFNLKISFDKDGVNLNYVLPTTQPIGLYSSLLGYIYDIKTVPHFNKVTGKKITKNYAHYLINVPYQTDLPKIVQETYFKLKKAAMLDARMYKIIALRSKFPHEYKKTVDRLNKEIIFLKSIKDGDYFGGYMMTEKYKQEQELIKLEDEFISTTI